MRADAASSADRPFTPPGQRQEVSEALVRSSLDGMISVDRAARVQVWNPAMERLTGLAAERCVGQPVSQVLAQVGAPDLAACFRRALAGERLTAQRRRIARAGGGERTLEGHYAPVLDAAGTIGGAFCVLRDVTEQQQLEEQLRQAQKMEAVGRLAGGVAHDFNNLLTVILGYCEPRSSRELRTRPAFAGDLGEIRRAARAAASLTRQLLAFSRQQVLQPQACRPQRRGRATSSRCCAGCSARTSSWSTASAPDAGRVLADRGQLEQVLMNLRGQRARRDAQRRQAARSRRANVELDERYARMHAGANARARTCCWRSATPAPAWTSRRARASSSPSSPPRSAARAPASGWRRCTASSSRAAATSGSTASPGHGTTFKIYLPARRGRPADARPPRTPRRALARHARPSCSSRTRTRCAAWWSRLLRTRGYRVLEADRGGRGAGSSPSTHGELQLLITDVVMPDMSGRRARRPARARLRPGLKVLFMSGYTDESIASHGVLDPGVELLEKPFTAEVLARRVRDVLDDGIS